MAKKFAYLTMAVIIVAFVFTRMVRRPRGCVLRRDLVTINTIMRDTFMETIPQTGIPIDSSRLVVEIDQLYKSRIKQGLRATAFVNNAEVCFRISQVDTTVINGKFSVNMNVSDTSIDLTKNKSVRLRIRLSEPRQAILIPVGGFYKDTGGKWVYVTTDEKHFVRREVKLGPKNPDYFVVLEGLQPGEKVLTSSYENFPHRNTVALWEIQRLPVSMM